MVLRIPNRVSVPNLSDGMWRACCESGAIDELVAEGDKVWARATTRGTHQGPIFGIPATGKPVEMMGLTMVTIFDNRMVESWVKNDVMALMKQLGGESQSR